MADILLSYERTDRQRVTPIVALLESRGWSVAWEPATDDADARNAQATGCIVAAWSIDSVDSPAVLTVADHGLARGVLICVSIDFSRPPREFEQAPSLALAGWTGDDSSPKAQELLAAVGDLLARAPQALPAEPAAERPVQAAAAAHVDAPPVLAPPVLTRSPEPEPELEPLDEPEPEPVDEFEAVEQLEPDVQWPPVFDPGPEDEEHTFRLEPEAPAEADVQHELQERVPALVRRGGAEESVWAFPDEPEDDEERRPHLPPVLLRDRGPPPPMSAEDEESLPAAPARRGLGMGLVVGCAAVLAIVAAAGTLWVMDRRGGSTAGSEVAAVEPTPDTDPKPAPETVVTPSSKGQPQATKPPEPTAPEAKPQLGNSQEIKASPSEAKPQEIQPTPAALPKDAGLPKDKDVQIEDLLGQVTPRVEELLTDARRLIRIGDIRGARAVLAAPETATSGSLTFLLAETYDPNVLPPAQKAALADPERARSLYRKARDLGDGRAQARLVALKTS